MELSRKYIDALPTAMFVAGADHRLVDVNAATGTLVGLPAEQMLGTSMLEYVHPLDLERVVHDLGSIVHLRRVEGTYRVVRRDDGRTIWVHTHSTLLDDGTLLGFGQDITRLKEVEEALRSRAERLALALDVGRIVSWEIQLPERISVREGPVAAVYGGTVSPRGSLDEFLAVLVPEDAAGVSADLAHLAAHGGELVREVRMKPSVDAPQRWLMLKARGVADGPGAKPTRLVGVAMDISATKLAERRAQDSTARYEAIIDSSHEGILSVDEAQRIVVVNPAAARLFGYEPSELIGCHLGHLLPVSVRDRHQGNVIGFLASGATRRRHLALKVEGRHRDGTPIAVEASIARVDTAQGTLLTVMMRDDRERDAIAEQLVQTQARFANAFQLSPAAMMLVRASDRVLLEANEALFAMLGRDRDDVLGRTTNDISMGADPAHSQALWAELTAKGRVLNRPYRFRRKDGRAGDALLSATVIESGDGPLVLAVIVDRTEQSAIEQAARQSDQQLATLFRLAPSGLVLMRARDSVVVDCNDAFARMFGLGRDDIRGHDGPSVGIVATSPTIDLIWEQLRRDGRLRGLEVTMASEKRREVQTMVSAEPVVIDGEPHALVVIHDVTDRRLAEHAAAETERRFAELASTIHEAFWLADPATQRTLYVSPAYERIWGRSRDELYARNDAWLDAVVEGDRARVAAANAALPVDGPQELEYRIERPDKSIAWIRNVSYPVLDAAGKLIRVAGVAEDITARRRTEDQLRHAQKMESVGKLAGGVAHDFNNMLTVVASCCELLADVAPEGTETGELVAEIRHAGERAAALTRQLLAFSRREVVEPRVVDLNAIVLDTEKMLRRLLGEDVIVRTHLSARTAQVRADPGQLVQVLVNLAVNARDAMPDGGTLDVETETVMLDAATHAHLPRGRYVRLRVRDSGVGMPAEVRDHVFEPFFTTKGTGRGTGLGLSVVHGVVEQSGGSVEVQSEPGQGATFEIHLPLLDGECDEAHATARRPRRHGAETVLLVEDDDAVRRIAALGLESAGYRVITAPDGPHALELLARDPNSVAVLLTDVVMPAMDGRTLAREARLRAPHLKVLYTSGYTDDAVVRHGISHADVAFLPKPYTVVSLLQKVGDVLDSREPVSGAA